MSHPDAIAARLALRKANDLLRDADMEARQAKGKAEYAARLKTQATKMRDEAKATLERLGESGVGPLR